MPSLPAQVRGSVHLDPGAHGRGNGAGGAAAAVAQPLVAHRLLVRLLSSGHQTRSTGQSDRHLQACGCSSRPAGVAPRAVWAVQMLCGDGMQHHVLLAHNMPSCSFMSIYCRVEHARSRENDMPAAACRSGGEGRKEGSWQFVRALHCRYGFLSQVLWLPIHQEFVDSGHFFLRDRLGSAVKKCESLPAARAESRRSRLFHGHHARTRAHCLPGVYKSSRQPVAPSQSASTSAREAVLVTHC